MNFALEVRAIGKLRSDVRRDLVDDFLVQFVLSNDRALQRLPRRLRIERLDRWRRRRSRVALMTVVVDRSCARESDHGNDVPRAPLPAHAGTPSSSAGSPAPRLADVASLTLRRSLRSSAGMRTSATVSSVTDSPRNSLLS